MVSSGTLVAFSLEGGRYTPSNIFALIIACQERWKKGNVSREKKKREKPSPLCYILDSDSNCMCAYKEANFGASESVFCVAW